MDQSEIASARADLTAEIHILAPDQTKKESLLTALDWLSDAQLMSAAAFIASLRDEKAHLTCDILEGHIRK